MDPGHLLVHLDPALRRKLKNKEYTSINHFLRTVKDLEDSLSAISLPPALAVSEDQVLKDVTREMFRINDDQVEGLQSQRKMQSVVETLCQRSANENRATAYALLEASSRTTSGGDSFFIVQDLFGGPSLLIKPADVATQPIEVTVNSDGRHTVKSTNIYAVFQHSQLEDKQESATASVMIYTVMTEVIQQSASQGEATKPMRYRSLSVRAERVGDKEGQLANRQQEIPEGAEYSVTLVRGSAGLGVYFIQEGRHTIIDRKTPFFKDADGNPGPAEASGLMKRGDRLLEVDGKRVDGLPFDDVVQTLKASGGDHGRRGTMLRLQRGDMKRTPPPNLSLFQQMRKNLDGTGNRGGTAGGQAAQGWDYQVQLERGRDGLGVNLLLEGRRLIVDPREPFTATATAAMAAAGAGPGPGGVSVGSSGGGGSGGRSSGSAGELRHIGPGDILVAVNGRDVQGLAVEAVVASMQDSRGQTSLRFQRNTGQRGSVLQGLMARIGATHMAGMGGMGGMASAGGMGVRGAGIDGASAIAQSELLERVRQTAKQLDRQHLQEMIEECSELLYMKELQSAASTSVATVGAGAGAGAGSGASSRVSRVSKPLEPPLRKPSTGSSSSSSGGGSGVGGGGGRDWEQNEKVYQELDAKAAALQEQLEAVAGGDYGGLPEV